MVSNLATQREYHRFDPQMYFLYGVCPFYRVCMGFLQVTLVFLPGPNTCRMRLFVSSKLTIGANVSVNGCLMCGPMVDSLCDLENGLGEIGRFIEYFYQKFRCKN